MSAHGYVKSWVIDGQAKPGFNPAYPPDLGITAERPTTNRDLGKSFLLHSLLFPYYLLLRSVWLTLQASPTSTARLSLVVDGKHPQRISRLGKSMPELRSGLNGMSGIGDIEVCLFNILPIVLGLIRKVLSWSTWLPAQLAAATVSTLPLYNGSRSDKPAGNGMERKSSHRRLSLETELGHSRSLPRLLLGKSTPSLPHAFDFSR